MAIATGKGLSAGEQGVLRTTVEEGLLGDGINGEGKDKLVPVIMGIFRETLRTGDFASAVQKWTKRLFPLLDAAVKDQLEMHSDNVQHFQRELELVAAGKSEFREAHVREDLMNAIEDAQAAQNLAARWNAAVSQRCANGKPAQRLDGATGHELSPQELRALEVARDLWVSSNSDSKNELAAWAVDALQGYFVAGCDKREFTKRLPPLLALLVALLEHVAEISRDPAGLEGEDEETIREDVATAAAADTLIARMRQAPQ